jgi:hypothetical protein
LEKLQKIIITPPKGADIPKFIAQQLGEKKLPTFVQPRQTKQPPVIIIVKFIFILIGKR